MKKSALEHSADEFLRIYNELDAFMRQRLSLDEKTDHSFMIQEMAKKGYRVFSDFGYELRLFARLRNAIVHNPYLKTSTPIAEPHPEIIEKYQHIRNMALNPPKALSIAIPGSSIFTATLRSNVQDLLKIMLEKSYTHVPIIEKDHMIGVFSENTLFTYLVHNKNCIITDDFTIKEFADYIPIDKHLNEYYEFVTRETSLTEVVEIFQKGLKNLKKVAVVYITEHGKPEEKLLGMITVWDLAGK